MEKRHANTNFSFLLRNFYNFKLPAKPKNIKAKLNILFIGSLIENKGIKQFVDASKANDFDFNVCGNGNKNCLDYVLDAQRQGFIKHHEVVNGKVKEELYGQADIYILQTSYKIEGVPLALLKAMAYSCAILTTKHNGIPETVGDEALFLEDLSAKELISKIKYLDKNRKFLTNYQQRSLLRSIKFNPEYFKNQIKIIIESN